MENREIKFRSWDGHGMDYNVERAGQFGFTIKNFVVMQFSGLRDVNNNEIYEGDIVKQSISEGHEWAGIHEVVFSHGAFKLKGGNPHGERYGSIFNYHPKNVEVIGNVYKNPELLNK